jgi:amidase
MPDAELLLRPVTELAALVRAGEVAARELVDLALDRIEALDSRVNAFIDVDADGARAAAEAIAPGDDRPLAGVPLGVKGNRAVAGRPLTLGAEFMGDLVAPRDHGTVQRLRQAGCVVVGSTNLPEWGIQPVTEPRRFGPTRNPWDLERTPGGSSGGSAAAVAAGMVPVASANDGGGSIRIPAACCGLVGLKAQRGRISMAPDVGGHLLAVDGVLTRTVAESALLLDVLAGPEPGDAFWAPPPPEPFAQAARREPPALRIALALTPPLPDAPVAPACVEATRDAARLLESLGHAVEEVEAPWSQPGLFDTFARVFGPAVCVQIAVAALVREREPTEEDLEPLSWWLWQRTRALDATAHHLAELRLMAAARAIVTWSAPYDAVLTPALAEPPVPVGALDPTGPDPEATFARAAAFTPWTAVCNMTGQPAISLPLFAGDDGLPLAVHLIGRPAGEGPLLALAAQLEAARPWAQRRPPVFTT